MMSSTTGLSSSGVPVPARAAACSPKLKWTCIISSTMLVLSLSALLLIHKGIIRYPDYPKQFSFAAVEEGTDSTYHQKGEPGSLDADASRPSQESSSAEPGSVFENPLETPNQATSSAPSEVQSLSPSSQPSDVPSIDPSNCPSGAPTSGMPTEFPSHAPTDAAPEKVTFYVLGDIPYEDDEKDILEEQMKDIPRDADFVVHIGDINDPTKDKCRQSVYSDVRKLLVKSRAPVFITPGDNDINDCPDPERARTHWLNYFSSLEDKWENHELPVVRQESRKENFAFFFKGTLFIGVNLVGDANIFPDETAARHVDNVRWTLQQLAEYGHRMATLVIFAHAKPRTSRYHKDYFTPVLRAVESIGKPTMYIHGDFHFYDEGRITNTKVKRLQVDMGKDGPPVKVTVRPNQDRKFDIDRRR